jgi:hypothetical protein
MSAPFRVDHQRHVQYRRAWTGFWRQLGPVGMVALFALRDFPGEYAGVEKSAVVRTTPQGPLTLVGDEAVTRTRGWRWRYGTCARLR